MLDREQALALLNELGPEKHLIQHALATDELNFIERSQVLRSSSRRGTRTKSWTN